MEHRPHGHISGQSLPGHFVLDHHIYDHYVANFSLHPLVNQLDCYYERHDFVRRFTFGSIQLVLICPIEC